MSDSSQSLFREFVSSRSEAAFGQVVEQHMPLVYSTALRRTNQASGIAQEVAQDVFTRLARKAGSLPGNVCLAAWLYRQTCRIAASAMRGEKRRVKREATAIDFMNDLPSESENALVGELDEAMARLPKISREALILRFFMGQNHREMGRTLGVSEEAARKRSDRGLDLLRGIFERRGIRVSVPAVVAALTALNSKTLPAAMQARISEEALKAPAIKVGLSTSLAGFLAGMMGVSAVAGGVVLTRKAPVSSGVGLVQISDRVGPAGDRSEKGDLISRIKRVCKGPNNVAGEIRLFAVLEELDDAEIPDFVEASAALLNRSERELCYRHLLERWVKSDPIAALNYALHSEVSLLMKYENSDDHEGGPEVGFLHRLAHSWYVVDSDQFADWLVENHDVIKELHGDVSLRVVSRNFLRAIGHLKGIQAELEFSSRIPRRQAYLLRMIYGIGRSHLLKTEDVPQLLEYLPRVSGANLQRELRKAVWTAWAAKEPEKMLSRLGEMDGRELFEARLALLGQINPLGRIQQYAGGHAVHVLDGKPFATFEEREGDALKAGVAAGLTESEALREIFRWHVSYGTSDHAGNVLEKMDEFHESDDVIEEGIRARLSQKDSAGGRHFEVFDLALLIEGDVLRREVVRAIFRNSLQIEVWGRSLLEKVDPVDPLRGELEEMIDRN